MTDTPVRTHITVEDVLNFNEDAWEEVVDGEIIKPDMQAAGFLHVIVIDNLFEITRPFVKKHKLGRVQTDGLTFILHVNEVGVPRTRLADFSFIRRGRIPKGYDWSLPFRGAPDLAIEVVSPSEKIEETLAKKTDYLRYGSEQVWVIYPASKELHVYHRENPDHATIYKENDTVDTSAFFPGLKLVVRDVFGIEED